MPDVKIYVRSEDWEKWYTIADKPKWLHEHLNMPLSFKDLKTQVEKLKGIPESPETIIITAKTKANYCKEHGMDKKFCNNMKHKAQA